jgi:hypothetical protein
MIAALLLAAACHAEVIAPVTGPRREEFVRWAAAHVDDFEPHSQLRIADIDNDGVDEYVVTSSQGSGGYLGLDVFRPAGDGWRREENLPFGDELQLAHDYFDPITGQRQVLVRFCGKTYVTLLGGPAPNYSRDAWIWERGKAHPVCDAPWLAEQRREFQRLFDHQLYDEAHGFLAGLEATCRAQAAPATWLWMESDLALAAYHAGTYAECLGHIAAARGSTRFSGASEELRRALDTNERLCRAAPPPRLDAAWLVALAGKDVQFVLDRRFDALLSAIVPEATFEGQRLRDVLKQNIFLPGPVQFQEGRYLVVSGCRPHDCGDKGFIWIDLQANKAIVAVPGVIASKAYAAAAIPGEAWRALADIIPFADDKPATFIDRNGRSETVAIP